MKKRLFISLACVAAVLLCGCDADTDSSSSSAASSVASLIESKSDSSMSSTDSSFESSKSEDSGESEGEERVLYDKDGLTITYIGFRKKSVYHCDEFRFRLSNHSGEKIKIKARDVYINGISTRITMRESLGGNKSVLDGIEILSFYLQEYNIDEVKDVKFVLECCYDDEKSTPIYTSDPITIADPPRPGAAHQQAESGGGGMTVKEYLGQAYRLDQRINSKLEQVASLNELATKCTSTLTGMPRNPNRGTSTMADAVGKIVDLQAEINRDIDRLVDLKREMVSLIKAVDNTEYGRIRGWKAEACENNRGFRSA